MPSHHDPFTTDLRVGQWFTIEDEFDSRPGFLRDHDESYFRAHRPDSCPPPGVPMRVVARHEHYIYASAMSWNGQEWCPAIVDLRRHDVVPLPDSIPAAINAHVARERRKNQPPMPRPRSAGANPGGENLQSIDTPRSTLTATPAGLDRSKGAPTVSTAPPKATSSRPDHARESGWIELRFHPRRIAADLMSCARWANPVRLFRRRSKQATVADHGIDTPMATRGTPGVPDRESTLVH
ncbi:MAG: hypothetical protein RLZZ461_269 [Planctomycetota bacterium]|jgi:hypothetical protein